MDSKRDLTCIGCPMGCQLQVTLSDSKITVVNGNQCKIGKTYAEKECTNPTRILTSIVQVEGGIIQVVSVKAEQDIPKDKIYECANLLKDIIVKAPVRVGDVILDNIFETGVKVIATKNVDAI